MWSDLPVVCEGRATTNSSAAEAQKMRHPKQFPSHTVPSVNNLMRPRIALQAHFSVPPLPAHTPLQCLPRAATGRTVLDFLAGRSQLGPAWLSHTRPGRCPAGERGGRKEGQVLPSEDSVAMGPWRLVDPIGMTHLGIAVGDVQKCEL